MADPELDDFDQAWRQLRAAVEGVERGEASRDDLAESINAAISTRTHARGVLTDANGFWRGDQLLDERERALGVNARVLDKFVVEWTSGRCSNLSASALTETVRKTIVEPGSR